MKNWEARSLSPKMRKAVDRAGWIWKFMRSISDTLILKGWIDSYTHLAFGRVVFLTRNINFEIVGKSVLFIEINEIIKEMTVDRDTGPRMKEEEEYETKATDSEKWEKTRVQWTGSRTGDTSCDLAQNKNVESLLKSCLKFQDRDTEH